MLQRRRWQRGAVYLRRGKRVSMWYGRWREDSLTPDGRLQRRYRKVRLGTFVEVPTRAAARAALSKHLESPAVIPTSLKFSDLCDRWRTVHQQTLKTSTFEHYRNALRGIEPVFGQAEVNSITRHEVERFILDRAKRYSKSSVRSLRTTLSILMDWAVANSWLEKNPVKGVKLPRACGGRTVSRQALSPELVMKLSRGLEEPFSTLVIFLAATGLRIGEACGLRWADISNDVLHVRRRVYGGKVDELKTEKSKRRLPLSPELVARLKTLWKDDSWVFQSRNGSFLNPGNWLKREIRPVAKKLGITLSGWHDFRHTLSTHLRQDGTHPKLVSAILGHSRVQLALDTYDHASTEELALPLARISGNLNPTEPKFDDAA